MLAKLLERTMSAVMCGSKTYRHLEIGFDFIVCPAPIAGVWLFDILITRSKNREKLNSKIAAQTCACSARARGLYIGKFSPPPSGGKISAGVIW
jgi:hypothetical protein